MNKITLTISLVYILFFAAINGSLEVGFHVLLQSKLEIGKLNWTLVSGWTNNDMLLVFDYGLKFDNSKTSVSVPFGGLYFISANLAVNAEEALQLKVCITSDYCQATDQNETSNTIAFISYLHKGQNVNIRVHGSLQFTVNRKSSFAMQYLGSMSSMPGFVSVLKKNSTVHINHESRGVKLRGFESQPGPYDGNNINQDLLFRDGVFSVKCDGIYLISASFCMLANKGAYEIRIEGSSIISKFYKTMITDGVTTMTMFFTAALAKTDKISLKILGQETSITFLKYSTFSAVYVGPVVNNLTAFSFVLPTNRTFPSGRKLHYLTNYIPRRLLKKKLIRIGDQQKYQFAMSRNGIYLLSLLLHVNKSSFDELTVKISVWNAGIETIIAGNAHDVFQLSGKETVLASALLTSVVSLRNSDFVTIMLESRLQNSFTVLKMSQLCVTLVRTGILAAGFNVNGGQFKNLVGSVERIMTLSPLPYEAFSLNRFLGIGQVSFRCPLRGLYSVSLNMVLTGSYPGSQIIQLHIRKRTSQNVLGLDIFNATYSITNSAASSYSPSSVYSLQENDRLSFVIDSKFSFTVNERSCIFISFIDYVESGRTVIAVKSSQVHQIFLPTNGPYLFRRWLPDLQSSKFFIDNHVYTTLESGFHLISCIFQLKVDLKNDINSLQATLVVHFSDSNANFGLRDMNQISGSNETKILVLNINGVLETKAKSKLITLLKVSEHQVNISIVYARLAVSFYSSRQHALSNSFRCMMASTKLLSLDNDAWKYIGKSVQKDKDGEFKSADVEFVGPHFLAKQPLVGLAAATTRIQGVDGALEFGVVIISGSEILEKPELTIETHVQGDKETTLNWNGLVYLEAWQQLSLAVKRKRRNVNADGTPEASLSRSSWSSLSFLGLSVPGYRGISSNNFKVKKIFARGSNAVIVSDGLYIVRQHNSSDRHDKIQSTYIEWRNKEQLTNVSHVSIYPIPFSKFKKIWSHDVKFRTFLTGKSLYLLDDIFANTKVMRNGMSAAFNNQKCLVGILSIKLIVSYANCTKLSLIQMANGKQLTLAFSSVLSLDDLVLAFYAAYCLDRNDRIGIICQNRQFEIAVAADSKLSFAEMDNVENVEGFSAMPIKDHSIQLSKDEPTRVDVWSINSSFCFDSSIGFKPPFGSYSIITTGQYLITAHILLKTSFVSQVQVDLILDNSDTSEISSTVEVSDHEMSTVSFAAVLTIEKARLLQLRIIANFSSSVYIAAGSSFSVLLIDQEVTGSYCPAESVSIRTITMNRTALRIGETIIIQCESRNGKIVDFYWFHNNKVISFIPSSTNGTLIIPEASSKHSGTYVCQIQIGDFTAVSNGTNILIYDPTPVISVESLNIFVAENSIPNQDLLGITVNAATSQGTTDAPVQLSIFPYDQNKIFYIVPNETSNYAQLRSCTPFDYEAEKLYSLIINARNKNFQGEAESKIEIAVHVIDKNDNPPRLNKGNYNVAIYENVTVGDEIYQIVATDRDSKANARIDYIFHENEDAKYFNIDRTSGVVKLAKPIMKEGRKSYTLFVIARNEQFKTFATLSVHVIDVNNNRPYFDPVLYIINITEQTFVGNIISKLHAYDLDRDQSNEKLHYEIIVTNNSNVIMIDKQGFIRVSSKLWEYAGKQLIYTAEVYDDGGLAGSNKATIIVNVMETFRRAYKTELRFEKETYHVKVEENLPIGSFILQVKAFFPISSVYILKYVCLRSKDSGNFSISESDGNIYTRSLLDFEAVKEYSLKVFACDIEGRTACTVTNIVVEVEDTNDHLPTFAALFYNITITKDTAIGSSIFQVNAQDSDVGKFGEIIYEIESNNNAIPFTIGRIDGILRTEQTFNATSVYVLVISASNEGTFTKVRQCILQIFIMEQYGYADLLQLPRFAKERYEIVLPEDFDLDQKVTNITASISDDERIQYALYGNYNLTFKVDADLGSIYLRKRLDFEMMDRYDLFLIAEANNDVSLRGGTRIIINVFDKNDNRPIFINSNQQTYFQRETKPGSLMTRIYAYDRDSGINGQITYKLESEDHFMLASATGDLKVKSIAAGMSYHIKVYACDHGIPSLCGTANITVFVSKAEILHNGLRSQLLPSNCTTSIELQFDIDEYIPERHDTILLRFIAQEIHSNHPEYESYTQLPALSWYAVNYLRNKHNNFLRRFVASESLLRPTITRQVRDLENDGKKQTMTTFTFGVEKDCDKTWMIEQICNGPLRPETLYRFQLEFRYNHFSHFIKTGFTKSYKTGLPNARSSLPTRSKNKFPFWIIFISVSVLLVLVLLTIFICCCIYCWKRRRRRIPQNYKVQIKEDCPQEYFLPRKKETECQELTLWFSEESLLNNSTHRLNAAEEITDV